MQAIEFEAKSKDGVIEIPAEFADFASENLRVVLMKETPQEQEAKIVNLQKLVDDAVNSEIGQRSMSDLLVLAKKQLG